jgi:predicted  nucleic acid-binding Zn-ribbon protein
MRQVSALPATSATKQRDGAAALSPESLAAEINLLHEAAEQHANLAVVYAARCGEKLLKVKAALGHGEWLGWLEANCGVTRRQASRYMRLAREMPELLAANGTSTSHLPGIEHAIALLSATDEVKADVQVRVDAGEAVTVREIEGLKREAQAAREAWEQMAGDLAHLQRQNQTLQQSLTGAVEREQRVDQELRVTRDRIAVLAEEQSRATIEQARSEVEAARQATAAAQQRVDDLRQKLIQAEHDQKAAIERGVNYNLAQRQVELDRLERDIQHAEKNLASFRQKLREISSAEYENQRLNLDAEKVLREIVLFGTTLNLYECEEIFAVNWGLLDQIVLGAESLAALIGDFKAARRLTEKPVSAS